MKTRTSRSVAVAVAAAFGGVVGPVAAVTFDLSPFAELGTRYERNLLRVESRQDAIAASPTGDDRISDTAHSLSGGVTFEADAGLQSLVATVQLSRADYQHFDQLDHSGYDSLFGWQWGVGRLWDGELGWRATRSLDSFDNRSGTARNFRSERQVRASAGLAVAASWRAEVLFRGDRRENTLLDRQRFDVDERLLEVVALYVAQPVLRAGVGVRRVDGEYPRRNAQQFPDLAREYQDIGIDLRATWQPSGISTLDARLGRTERSLDPVQSQDFNGALGHVEYRREISGKTAARLRVFRDLFAVENVDANFIESTGVRAGVTWAPRSKLEFELAGEYLDQVFAGGNQSTNAGRQRSDHERNGTLTIRWQILERLALVGDLEREIQQSSEPGRSAAWWRAGLKLRVGF